MRITYLFAGWWWRMWWLRLWRKKPTYKPTTHYVTRTAKGGGDGSRENPWTLKEAFEQAKAGNVIEISVEISNKGLITRAKK